MHFGSVIKNPRGATSMSLSLSLSLDISKVNMGLIHSSVIWHANIALWINEEWKRNWPASDLTIGVTLCETIKRCFSLKARTSGSSQSTPSSVSSFLHRPWLWSECACPLCGAELIQKKKKTPPVNRSLSSEVSEKYKVFHSFSGPAPCRNQKDAHEATLQGVKDEALNPFCVCGFLLSSPALRKQRPMWSTKRVFDAIWQKIAPIFSGRRGSLFLAKWPMINLAHLLQVVARLILMCDKKRGVFWFFLKKSPQIWRICFARNGPWNSHIDSGSTREEIFSSIFWVDQIWWFLHLKNY